MMYFIQIPVMGAALNRLRAYSCDRHGAYAASQGIEGLLFLAADRQVYLQVNLDGYLQRVQECPGAWERLAELIREQADFVHRVRAPYKLDFFSGAAGAR
jgi:hypothetical protein